jgi:hypothetical protein
LTTGKNENLAKCYLVRRRRRRDDELVPGTSQFAANRFGSFGAFVTPEASDTIDIGILDAHQTEVMSWGAPRDDGDDSIILAVQPIDAPSSKGISSTPSSIQRRGVQSCLGISAFIRSCPSPTSSHSLSLLLHVHPAFISCAGGLLIELANDLFAMGVMGDAGLLEMERWSLFEGGRNVEHEH